MCSLSRSQSAHHHDSLLLFYLRRSILKCSRPAGLYLSINIQYIYTYIEIYIFNRLNMNSAAFPADTWRVICWRLCPRSWQVWGSCRWCKSLSDNLEYTHLQADTLHLFVHLCVCVHWILVSAQGPEQQQHQHIGPLHLQQHDSTSHTVSYHGNATRPTHPRMGSGLRNTR